MAQKEATLLIKIKETGSNLLKEIGDRFVITAGDIVGAVGSIYRAIGSTLAAYAEQERAINELNTSLINQGIYSKQLSNSYQDMATELQRVSTFGDEAIVSSQALLQGYLGETKVTKELMTAVLNLATAKKMDLGSATDIIAKSIGTSTNALARHGVQLDDNMTKSQRLSAVVQQLNQRFGGQAEAATQGLGAWAKLKNTWSDILEVAGEKLAPMSTRLVNLLDKIGQKFLELANKTSPAKMTTEELTAEIGRLNLRLEELRQKEQSYQDLATASRTGAAKYLVLRSEIDSTIEKINELNEAVKKEEQLHREAEQKKVESTRRTREENLTEQNQKAIDNLTARELEQQMELADNETMFALRAKFLDDKIAKETDAATKADLIKQKERVIDMQATLKHNEWKKKQDEEVIAARKNTLSVFATLANSNNSTLAAIGKAAAITQIAIATPVAVAEAIKWGTSMGSPALGAVFAGITYAAMAAQMAQVMGVQLAEGGIVMPRPGGVQATIGEAGQAEAVIPLDKAGGFGNTTVNLTVNGGLLGDASSAKELALAIDAELLKLRQNRESLAFDSGVV